jgi:hypothetical protein
MGIVMLVGGGWLDWVVGVGWTGLGAALGRLLSLSRFFAERRTWRRELHLLGSQGDSEMECGALPRRTGCPNFATVAVDQVLHDG